MGFHSVTKPKAKPKTKPKERPPGVAEDGTVALDFFATIYDLHPERVRQLIKEGWIPRGPRARVDMIEGARGMDRYRLDQLARAGNKAQDTRVKDAKAREIEMRIAEKQGSLIDFGEALAICQTLFGALKSELDGLATSVTREREFRHRIEDRINGALNRVVKRLEVWSSTGRLSID